STRNALLGNPQPWVQIPPPPPREKPRVPRGDPGLFRCLPARRLPGLVRRAVALGDQVPQVRHRRDPPQGRQRRLDHRVLRQTRLLAEQRQLLGARQPRPWEDYSEFVSAADFLPLAMETYRATPRQAVPVAEKLFGVWEWYHGLTEMEQQELLSVLGV